MSGKVSILLLGWNHERYVEQCIQSCIDQTHKVIEILFMDNCSKDNTFELAEKLLASSGVSYQAFKRDVPEGITKNFNFLLERATGEFVAVLSTDDWFEQTNFEKKIPFFADPEVGAVFSGGWVYFEQTREKELIDTSKFMNGRIFKEILLVHGAISNIGMCYRRSALVAIGGWDNEQLIDDVDVNVQVALRYKFEYIKEPLVYYRRMNATSSGNVDYMIRGYEMFHKKYASEKWIDMDNYIGKRYADFAALSIDQGGLKMAAKLLRKAVYLNGLTEKNCRTFLYLCRIFIKKRVG